MQVLSNYSLTWWSDSWSVVGWVEPVWAATVFSSVCCMAVVELEPVLHIPTSPKPGMPAHTWSTSGAQINLDMTKNQLLSLTIYDQPSRPLTMTQLMPRPGHGPSETAETVAQHNGGPYYGTHCAVGVVKSRDLVKTDIGATCVQDIDPQSQNTT